MLGPCWRYVGSFFVLGRFLDALCISCCVLLPLLAGFDAFWGAPGSILEGSGTLRGGFWRSQGPIFRGFCMPLHALALEWRGCSDPYKTLAGVVRNAHRSMLAIQRMTQKTNKNRPDSFSNKQFGQERVQIRIWSAPRRILEKFRHLPSASWPALGRSWAALGLSWALLRQLLGPSWTLVGLSFLVSDASWANFASPGPPQPRFWRVWGRAGLVFARLWSCVWACLLLRLSLCYFSRPQFVVGDCNAFLATCLRPLHYILDTMLALWHVMFLLVQ